MKGATSSVSPLDPGPVSLPAFLRVEHGMPWGHWIRFDTGAIVIGSAPGLGLSLIDASLAPYHAVIQHTGQGLMVEALRADAELRVDGCPARLELIEEPCTISLGHSHLQLLPPPRSVAESSAVLTILRRWLRPDPATGLPAAAHLLEALAEGCPGPGEDCHQTLLLARPETPDRCAARTLRQALPPDTLICRAGPEQLAALLPEGPPPRLLLPSTWQVALRECHRTAHQPEALLFRTREALTPRPINPEADSASWSTHHPCA